MVQLKIFSGKTAGDTKVVRHFPFHIGRAAAADLRLEEPGVFDQHLELDFDPAQGFILHTHANALATVNGWPVQNAILRNGDTIEIGALKIRFWLGETRQSRLRLPEALVWLAIAAVTAAQIFLLLWLMR
jgi:pSer/pThr/pTyr-binding forkhead associated (FHA) protein